ncbi:CNNM domain-containing protein, partial [Salmonella enterica subsp. enterica serovar Montevideo]|nr:CNNM domain-containing protein [Salmonella enterica subsp. enterica serovar Montevideo]
MIMVVISAYFSGSETGMMTLNRYRLRHMAKQGNRSAKRVEKLIISGTRRTSGMRPLVEKICRKLCGPGKILSRRCIKERDATSGT